MSKIQLQPSSQDSEKREKFLLRKINESVLNDSAMERYILLQNQLELGNITPEEYKEFLQLVDKEEKTRNKRFQYLIELAQLQAISLPALLQKLGLNTFSYA